MTAQLVIGNYNYSSWSLRAWLVACVSGLEFSVRCLPMDTEQFRNEIKTLSPSGLVPVLRHEGNTIWDSLAIAEYLAERFPDAKLWPRERGARASARAIAAEMHGGFPALRRRMPLNCRAKGRRVPLDDPLQADIKRIEEIWVSCLARSGGPFLFTDFSIADAMYAPVVSRFQTYGVAQSQQAQAYSARVLKLAPMVEWMSRAEAEPEIIEAEEVGVQNTP